MKTIKVFFSHIFLYLSEIFLENPSENTSILPSSPIDLTGHYAGELDECFMDSIIIARHYRDIEKILESYKYHSERGYRDTFVALLSGVIDTLDRENTDVALVSIPMHWSRYVFRGFDHMGYIADALALVTGIHRIQPLSTRFSQRQSRLSRKKRLENRKNHFTMNLSEKLPETIILIDDVISTGSTANECARVLKKHGVKQVFGVFLSSNQ